MGIWKKVCLLGVLVVSIPSALATSSTVWQTFTQLQQAGILVLNAEEQPVWDKKAQQLFIPASTTKLITALLALQHWGDEYRFKTEFYLIPSGTDDLNPVLLIKGFGDPFLVSEELALMAQELAKRLTQQNILALSGVWLDTGYYQKNLVFPGAGQTDNPYDAAPSALAANFNTVYLQMTKHGIDSAEPQTPVTPTALAIAQETKVFEGAVMGEKKRINLGSDEQVGQRHFAELFMTFLAKEGVEVFNRVQWRALGGEHEARLIYQHENQRTLAEVVASMMKYSTNFIANQLALNLAHEWQGQPVGVAQVAAMFQHRLVSMFGWKYFVIEEGAGLSRNNRLSPEQLIDVLKAFQPWQSLLLEVTPGVYAKSGTLLGVSTLAGYAYKENKWHSFALMINQSVPFHYRYQLIQALMGEQ